MGYSNLEDTCLAGGTDVPRWPDAMSGTRVVPVTGGGVKPLLPEDIRVNCIGGSRLAGRNMVKARADLIA
jgi:hypothetical protein